MNHMATPVSETAKEITARSRIVVRLENRRAKLNRQLAALEDELRVARRMLRHLIDDETVVQGETKQYGSLP